MPGFNPVPSLDLARLAAVSAATTVPASATAVAVPVIGGGTVPDQADADAAQLDAAGFDGAVGSSVVLPSTDGTLRVAVGVGDPDDVSADTIRDAAGAFGRATRYDKLAVHLPATGVDPARGAQAVVEGVLLSRYTYDALRSASKAAPVAELTLVTDDAHVADVQAGAERGRLLAAATMAARDLANTPHSHLNAIGHRRPRRRPGRRARLRRRGLRQGRSSSSWAAAACSASTRAASSRPAW